MNKAVDNLWDKFDLSTASCGAGKLFSLTAHAIRLFIAGLSHRQVLVSTDENGLVHCR